jgi:acyl carrier protein
MPECAQELRAFIRNNFLYGSESPDLAFGDEDSLVERGIIDSTGILELIAFLEMRYAIVIDDDELVPDNLDSVSRVARFVERKLQPVAR